MESANPFVRAVVINYDGGQMTIDCLESLLATDYPADRLDIVMVDNGSLDDVVERVAVELPSVRVIEPLANTGFAGGCNLGIRAPGEFDLVALVNKFGGQRTRFNFNVGYKSPGFDMNEIGFLRRADDCIAHLFPFSFSSLRRSHFSTDSAFSLLYQPRSLSTIK
jgi:hypothetical protein